jgi:hypothetical protein
MLIHSWFENKATRHKSDLQNSQQRAWHPPRAVALQGIHDFSSSYQLWPHLAQPHLQLRELDQPHPRKPSPTLPSINVMCALHTILLTHTRPALYKPML